MTQTLVSAAILRELLGHKSWGRGGRGRRRRTVRLLDRSLRCFTEELMPRHCCGFGALIVLDFYFGVGLHAWLLFMNKAVADELKLLGFLKQSKLNSCLIIETRC